MTSFLFLAALTLSPATSAEGKAVPYHVYTSYFEKNSSGLTGDTSYLALTSREAFDRVFGAAATMRTKEFLPDDAFERRLVVAVVKRGDRPWRYHVKDVTAEGGTLTVRYDAHPNRGGSARFASPLILAVDRGDYSKVEFIENGRRVGETHVEK